MNKPTRQITNQPVNQQPTRRTRTLGLQGKNLARSIAGTLSSYYAVGGREVAFDVVLERLKWLMVTLEVGSLGWQCVAGCAGSLLRVVGRTRSASCICICMLLPTAGVLSAFRCAASALRCRPQPPAVRQPLPANQCGAALLIDRAPAPAG